MSGDKNVFRYVYLTGFRSCLLYFIGALVFSSVSFAGGGSTSRTELLYAGCQTPAYAENAIGPCSNLVNTVFCYTRTRSACPFEGSKTDVMRVQCPSGYQNYIDNDAHAAACYQCPAGSTMVDGQCLDHGCETGFNDTTQDCFPQSCGYGDAGQFGDPSTCNDLPNCQEVDSNFCPDGEYCPVGYYYSALADRCVYGNPPGSSSSAQNSSQQSSQQQSSQNSSEQSSDNSQSSSADSSGGSNNSDGGGSNSSGGSGGSSGSGSSSGGGDAEASSGCVEQPPCTGDAIQCAILEQQWINGCNKQKEVDGHCEGGFVCKGDPIGCASLEIQFLQQCQNRRETVLSELDDFMQSEGLEPIDDTVELNEEFGIDELVGDFLTPEISYEGQCIEDIPLNIGVSEFVIPTAPICELAGYLRIFVIASASLTAIFTFFRIGFGG